MGGECDGGSEQKEHTAKDSCWAFKVGTEVEIGVEEPHCQRPDKCNCNDTGSWNEK